MATHARPARSRIEWSTDPLAQENDHDHHEDAAEGRRTHRHHRRTGRHADRVQAAPAGAADTSALADGHSVGAGQTVGTDPLIPFGTEPMSPVRLGYVDSNHDEANTSNGGVDIPF